MATCSTWNTCANLRRLRRRFFSRDPVNLFFQKLFLEADAFQHAFAVLDHLGMSAEIADRVRTVQPPLVGVLTHHVVDAADFARPLLIVPRTTYTRNISEPGNFFRELLKFFEIAELPRAAGTIQQE